MPHLQSIFADALELPSPAERLRYVREVCGEDEKLRAELEGLLGAHTDARDFLQNGAYRPEMTDLPPISEGPGTVVGPYKLLQQLGEGGMGIVYMAAQDKPVRRRVALKIIKPGMDTSQVIARFDAERQALALMDHPHIAKVLDAGATETGRPYFVMELVRGVPITDYCDRNQLTLRERLELFVLVCQAIQHAHQKGIIHRDIKPSNVLVTVCDGKPAAKVIDFGVAKATDQRLTERTLFTQFGQIVGTLEYMSPEQAEMGTLDIDTRTDIYSLGAVLYELLTGSTPLQRSQHREAGYVELLRRIREDDTPKPSTRISAADHVAAIAAQRRIEPLRLRRLLRGDLDWIVMKALEKGRTRRYETADGLARDIERYLDGDAVEAGPPSASYRLRKFAGKHRTLLGTTAAFVVLLFAAAAVCAVSAIRATRAEQRLVRALERANEEHDQAERERCQAEDEHNQAERARRRAEDEHARAVRALDRVEEERSTSVAMLDFVLHDILAATRPEGQEGGLGKDVTILQAIGAAEPKIPERFRNQPLVEASIRSSLGRTYFHLGDFAHAVEQYERAVALREPLTPCADPDLLTTRSNLADAYQAAGRPRAAMDLHEKVLKLREAAFGPNNASTLVSRGRLATALHFAGRVRQAIEMYESVLPLLQAKLEAGDPDTLRTRLGLADAYRADGRLDDAIKLHEETLKRMEAKLPIHHPDTLRCRSDLANVYKDAGRVAHAIAMHRETLELMKSKLAPDHPDTLKCQNNLALAYLADGQTQGAIVLLEGALKLMTSKLGPNHRDTLTTGNNLAFAYCDTGRFVEATALEKSTLERATSTLDSNDPITLVSHDFLAVVYTAAGQHAQAEPLLRDRLARIQAQFGPCEAYTISAKAELGSCLIRQEKWAAAETALRACLAAREKIGLDDWRASDTRSQLGASLLGQGRYADAEPLIVKGYEELRARETTIPASARNCLTEAARWVSKLHELRAEPNKTVQRPKDGDR